MELKSLVCLFFIFLSIHMSISNPESSLSSKQVQENQFQGSLIHGVGHVGAASSDTRNPSLHTTDARVQDEDEDHGSSLSYVKKMSHGMGGGAGTAVHHSGKNRASSLSTHSSFVFPCIIAIFGLAFFPII